MSGFVTDPDPLDPEPLNLQAVKDSLNLSSLWENSVEPSEPSTTVDPNAELPKVRDLLDSGYSVGCGFPVSQHQDGSFHVEHATRPEPKFVAYEANGMRTSTKWSDISPRTRTAKAPGQI